VETLEQITNKNQETEKNQINIKQRIFSAWEQKHNTRRTGAVHVSDLSHCLRQSCFRRLDKNPEPPNEQSIKSLLVGAAAHQYIENLLGNEEFESEKEIIRTSPSGVKLIAHPDMIHRPTNTIVEFKTSTAIAVMKTPYSSHLRQLKTYMAILNSQNGILLYILLNSESSKDGKYFQEYHITISPNERQYILNRLDNQAQELQKGFELADPSRVRHIAEDPDYVNPWTKTNWLCEKFCPYKEKCDIMRAQEKAQEKSTSRGRND
jgi:hypothetical protein